MNGSTPSFHFHMLLIPVFAMWLLTFLVWLRLYQTRLGAMFRQGIDAQAMKEPAVQQKLGPEAIAASDHFKNLFELPVLFYIVVGFILLTGSEDRFFMVLASAYVVLRYIHTLIHITYNRVIHRFVVYVLSCIALFWMMARFAWHWLWLL